MLALLVFLGLIIVALIASLYWIMELGRCPVCGKRRIGGYSSYMCHGYIRTQCNTCGYSSEVPTPERVARRLKEETGEFKPTGNPMRDTEAWPATQLTS